LPSPITADSSHDSTERVLKQAARPTAPDFSLRFLTRLDRASTETLPFADVPLPEFVIPHTTRQSEY